jgi:hypothetical protein
MASTKALPIAAGSTPLVAGPDGVGVVGPQADQRLEHNERPAPMTSVVGDDEIRSHAISFGSHV